jgi:SNF2 family DNA or RNA helicase
VGVAKSQIQILEALLRLRQVACHPALVDPSRTRAQSGKIDTLLPALNEIIEEGHKALVFSQFTSFLALVRAQLDSAGIAYEYLDGKTVDREQRVTRFQEDPEVRVFLLSLKAGGHGLNLTAADYVFLLDPWWNPAVEAQAIDRAHRIGQTRHVIATRLVARETIEEKILELQASKRALADAILTADQGVLSRITRDELEMLLA